MKVVYRLLFAMHLFVGIGAIAGGLAAITSPRNPLGMPVETLKNSPFSDFLIPGIILFTIIGLGNVFSAILFRYKLKYQAYVSGVISGALVIWIVVQCIMLQAVAALHVIFFMIGLLQCALSAMILFERRLFPANLVLDFYKRFKKSHSA